MADKFDIEVQKRNSKGQVIAEQPYRLLIEGGVRKYERPVGSGDWYFENNEPVNKQPKAEVKKA